MPSKVEKILAASSYSQEAQHNLAVIHGILYDPNSYEDTTDMNSTPAPVAQPKRAKRKGGFINRITDPQGELSVTEFTALLCLIGLVCGLIV